MKITHILHPTDFSEGSEAAMDYVHTLAKQYNAQVTMMFVVDELDKAKGWYVPHTSLNEFYKEMEENAKKKLEHCCYESLRDMPDVKRVIVKGTPDVEIAKYAEANGVDLIIMSTYHKSGMDNIFSSVTEKVLRRASCPVLVIKVKP